MKRFTRLWGLRSRILGFRASGFRGGMFRVFRLLGFGLLGIRVCLTGNLLLG